MYVITFKGRSEPAQFEAALDASIRFVHGFNIGQVTNIWPENGALARTATFQGRSLAKHAPDHFLGSKMVLQGLEYEDKRTIATEACIKKRFNLEGHIGYLESPGPKKSPVQQSQKSAGALDPHEIYCMHTPGAAQVLNIAGRGGSLEKGKLADMILFKPPDTRDYRKGYVSILVSASGIEDIESVFIGGLEEWPHIRPVPPPVDDDRWKHWHV
ncbi:hypothetical protein N7526_001862 [Penicillium atrosanguineum]|nr:hypothetical protein N7526_001862 [Penicillium atrosanguineum]